MNDYDPGIEPTVWLCLAVLITEGKAYGKLSDDGNVLYVATVHGGMEDALPIETIASMERWPPDWRERVAAW